MSSGKFIKKTNIRLSISNKCISNSCTYIRTKVGFTKVKRNIFQLKKASKFYKENKLLDEKI